MAKKRKAMNDVVELEETPSSSEDSEEEEEEESSASSSEEENDGDDSSDSSSDSSSEGEEEQNDGVSSKRRALKKLLEPLGRDQIIDLLKEAAAKDPSVRTRILQRAESDPTHRKIFVHGLGWDATEEQLREAFKPFGEIEELRLIADKATGRAKGYAFVLFRTISASMRALKVPQKRIGNRTTSCQLAALGRPGTGSNANAAAGDVGVGQRKLFVANVAPTVNVNLLRDFFGKFGELEEGPMGLDPVTNKPRGFAIFVYKSVDGLRRALEEPVKFFEGCQLNCKKFIDGLQSSNANRNNNNDSNYGFGSNESVGGMLMQQTPGGIGLLGNPMWVAALNQAGLAGAMAGIGGSYGINSGIAPTAIVRYGSQAALQGLGAQMGPNSGGGGAVGTTSSDRNHQSTGVDRG